MPQTFIDRVATLVRADAHGVVDALEERALLLKQHLRDAELELVEKRARLEGLGAEAARLEDAVARRTRELDALDEDVALALAGGKDDLARFAIRRLLPLRREREGLEEALRGVRAAHDELAARLAEQEHAFRDLRVRVRARLAEPAATGGEDGDAPAVSDEEVELELLRRRGAAGLGDAGEGREVAR